MPTAQKRNSSMQELTGVDQLNYRDRNFCAEWYDAIGGQNFLLGNPDFTVNLDTERLNTAPTVFSLASDIVTILEAGVYLFNYQITVSGNGNASSRFWLEEDPATGVFVEVAAATSYIMMIAVPLTASSGSVSTLLRTGANYRYRIRLEQFSGSTLLTTVANGTKLNIIRMWKNG